MEKSDKKNIFIEFGRSSKTAIGELIISESLLRGSGAVLFEETTKLEHGKMLGLRETFHNYPPDYLSVRSLAWIESSMRLPSVLKRIYNNKISPFTDNKNEI
jgi:hypothetical protein